MKNSEYHLLMAYLFKFRQVEFLKVDLFSIKK